LNTFGFLDLSELGGQRFASSGNVGMLDLVQALEWVRDNIAKFGGDPKTVMIFGQSGGGGKVNTLMAMPSAKGLFHRAAVQSGSLLRVAEPADSHKLADAVLRELSISKNDLGRLQTMPYEQVLEGALAAQRKVAPRPPGPPDFRRLARQLGWAPVVDGTVVPRQPFDPDAPSVSAEVPLLVGTVLNEFVNGIGKPDAFSMTEQELMEQMTAKFGDRSKDIVETFRECFPGVRPFQLYSVIMTSPVREGAVKQAHLRAASAKAPTYLYWFQWQTPILDGRPMAFHCAELSFCFDHTDRCERMTGGGPRARALAAKVSEAWLSFARNGNPNHEGLPEWSSFGSDTVPTMIFNDECRVMNDPDGRARKLVESASS
jgi:para-nitrobenzyl esterase